MSIEKELKVMFDRAIENVQKANGLIKVKATEKEAADRYIKLARRYYDIYKLFIDEFRSTIDVVAAYCMLHFIRSCHIVSNILLNANWLTTGSVRTSMRKFREAPQRAAHKVLKRTVKKNDYQFGHSDEIYEQVGFARLFSFAHDRQPKNELRQIATGLKEIGSRLTKLFDNSDLINKNMDFRDMGKPEPKLKKNHSLKKAAKDLKHTYVVLKEYYQLVTEELEKEVNPYDPPVDRDLCLVPLMDKLKFVSRKTLRGHAKNKSSAVMVSFFEAEDDILNITVNIARIKYAPIN